MTGKANLERARGLLAATDKILAVDAPCDVPVLLALLDLALKARELKAHMNACPIPFNLDGEVERALWTVKKVLTNRLTERGLE